ncbi:MAG: hypothetical protein SCK28_12230, partial [Bacillota bacterium]|nr:hypothetical protein [Bacillota bacterium]
NTLPDRTLNGSITGEIAKLANRYKIPVLAFFEESVNENSNYKNIGVSVNFPIETASLKLSQCNYLWEKKLFKAAEEAMKLIKNGEFGRLA